MFLRICFPNLRCMRFGDFGSGGVYSGLYERPAERSGTNYKVMMIALLVIMVILAVNSFFMPGAKEGLSFYLLPDFERMQEIGIGNTIVGAMNQAFFTLSLGVGAMAIFGSYIGKEHALLGESVRVVVLDTFVAITAGLIIFPACFTYHVDQTAGPSLILSHCRIFCKYGDGQILGQPVFPVYGFCGAVYRVGCV